jgi:hypothetical protein
VVLFPVQPRHTASALTQRYHAGENTLVGHQVERHASETILKLQASLTAHRLLAAHNERSIARNLDLDAGLCGIT